MKNRLRTDNVLAVLLIIGFTISTGVSSVSTERDNMKPKELIAKHLESIGAADARQVATSRIITGTAVVNFRQGGHGQIQGKAVLASQGAKNLIAMVFGAVDYPQLQDTAGFHSNRNSQQSPPAAKHLG